jgi:hypothetical protein
VMDRKLSRRGRVLARSLMSLHFVKARTRHVS